MRPFFKQTANAPDAVDIFSFSLGLPFRNPSISPVFFGTSIILYSFTWYELTCSTIPTLTNPPARTRRVITVVLILNSTGFELGFTTDVPLARGQIARLLDRQEDYLPNHFLYSCFDTVLPVNAFDQNENVNLIYNTALAISTKQYTINLILDKFDPAIAYTKKQYSICTTDMTTQVLIEYP